MPAYFLIPWTTACAGLLLAGAVQADDFALHGGVTIVNSFMSERSYAWSMDYHHPFTQHIDWSVAYLNEGHPEVLRRDGLATQLWAYKAYPKGGVTLAVGGGVYAHADTRRAADGGHINDHGSSPLLSLSVKVALSPAGFTRITWHRVVNDDNLDTDVILLGFGWNLKRLWGS